jgi:hypothetical protein
MQDRERAILWIVRCITAILLIRKQLGKPFRDATKDDVRSILKWMEQKGYGSIFAKTQGYRYNTPVTSVPSFIFVVKSYKRCYLTPDK